MSNEELGKEMSKRDQRKKYTAEFRTNAVRSVTELGLTNEMVAQRLGCTAESVRRWVMAHRRAMRPVQLQEEVDSVKELRAAQKRIKQLGMENEFLKKVTVYFAKESK